MTERQKDRKVERQKDRKTKRTKKTARQKDKKTKRQKHKIQKESLILQRQGSFALLRCFPNGSVRYFFKFHLSFFT